MNCLLCSKWATLRRRVYDDGTEVVLFRAPDGKGQCSVLDVLTSGDFGCNKFEEGAEPIVTENITGAAWQHWKMAPCPDCSGRGSGIEGGACYRCSGIGQVRHYDDGYVGEERTRKHPVELARDEEEMQEVRRKHAEAILQGLPLPEVIDPTKLVPIPKASVF